MRTLRLTAAAFALLALLAVTPALLRAAEGDPAPAPPPEDAAASPELVPLEQVNTAPSAAFEVVPDADPAAEHAAVDVGETVTLDASGSSDAEGAMARFEWDLDGDGVYESDGGAGAALQHAFDASGEFDLGLRVTDTAGATAEAEKRLTVEAPAPAEAPVQVAPEPEPEPERTEQPQAAAEPSAAKAAPEARTERRAARVSQADEAEPGEPRARTSASSSVAIRDFSFAPRSVTVNVGDTVTWTNNGDEVHTATADNGSFDTGNLSSGESGSHTFNEAGTFSYICKPHPFMKGTVRVAGASGGNAGAAGTDAGTGGSSGDDASGGLARTGSDLIPLTGLGLLMMLLGATLQRRERLAGEPAAD